MNDYVNNPSFKHFIRYNKKISIYSKQFIKFEKIFKLINLINHTFNRMIFKNIYKINFYNINIF